MTFPHLRSLKHHYFGFMSGMADFVLKQIPQQSHLSLFVLTKGKYWQESALWCLGLFFFSLLIQFIKTCMFIC